jgi:pyridoxal phosphate enzyme (YggS family)
MPCPDVHSDASRPSEPDAGSAEPRRSHLAANLTVVRDRIQQACERVGRDPGDVSLVAVTKTFPASDVRLLAGLGVRDIGENRHQEAEAKAAACADLDLTWHFVGQLQVNKARAVVRYASVIHSVDRLRLVTALGRAAADLERSVRCLVQVDLAGETGRGGVAPAEAVEMADAVSVTPGLELAGVMAVAPLGVPPGPAFARLAEVAAAVRARHAEATWISAGMSGDLETAVEHGATHVRVGRRLLGERPSNR